MRLAFEQWGRGERSLLMLHGFTGSRASFRHLKPLLAEWLRVIAVDLPGHGESPPPGARGEAGWRETLCSLGALLDELDLRDVDLFGYSQGARLALALALEERQRVRHLIVESGSPGLEDPVERSRRRGEDEALAQSIEREGIEAFVAKWEAQPLLAGLRRLPEAAQRELRERRLKCSASGLSGALRAFGLGAQPSLWPQLSGLELPVLALAGREDSKFVSLASRMCKELPRARLEVLSGAGHAPHLEASEAWAPVVASALLS
jgi:2-succinyl-6-hydroxy-2,4-cyclohexadiene-1-carboxylate synthase